MGDRLREPLPGTDKRFRDVTLVEQHELLFRMMEEVLDEIRALRAETDASGRGAGI